MTDYISAIMTACTSMLDTLFDVGSTQGTAPVLGTIAMLPIVGGVVGVVVSVVRRGRG